MKRILFIVMIILGIILIEGISQKSYAQNVVVIVNKENPIEVLSSAQVKIYYLRKVKKKWPKINVNIRPAKLTIESETNAAWLEILGMTESEINQYFTQRQFANAEALPEEFENETDLIEYVSQTKGAIGYISKSTFLSSDAHIRAIYTK